MTRTVLAGLTAGALVVGAGAAFAAAAPTPPLGRVAIETAASRSTVADVEQSDPEQSDECPEGLRNHGEHVSSVARSVEPGPGHGTAVRAAARSSCGKADKPSRRSRAATSPKASADEKAPKREKAERPVRGHERHGHPGRGPGRP